MGCDEGRTQDSSGLRNINNNNNEKNKPLSLKCSERDCRMLGPEPLVEDERCEGREVRWQLWK